MQKKIVLLNKIENLFFWCILYIIQEETTHSLIMCLEYRVVIVCLCAHIYALYQLYVCVFVYFSISQHCFLLFHLLKYYCIVFNHCVGNCMFVC